MERTTLWSTVVLIAGAMALSAGCGEAPGARSPSSGSSSAAAPKSPPAEIATNRPEETAAPETAAETITPAGFTTTEPAAPAAAGKKPERQPIYETDKPGAELIAAAVRRAERDHKHVLVEWGGNWCGWCYRLHDVFTRDQTVQPIVFEEFVLVLVDSNTNSELMHQYASPVGYPHLTVLDAKGKVLTNQNTEPLEKGQGHDPEVVAEFLRKWQPPKEDAEQALAAALKQAGESERRVLVRVGTPYCGWCNVLAQFVQDHAELIGKDYVDLKIDTQRMTNGEEVAKRYQPSGNGGVPWMVILDPSGKTLAHSFGSKGNIGYPYQPAEIDHFAGMLRETRHRLTDAELETMTADLNTFRIEREAQQSKRKAD